MKAESGEGQGVVGRFRGVGTGAQSVPLLHPVQRSDLDALWDIP